MAVFLSLLTAALYGTSDFCGGLAAQRAKLLQVVAGGHLVGLVGVVIASVLVADEFDTSDFLLGAAGGAFGAVAISLLYRRLAIGQAVMGQVYLVVLVARLVGLQVSGAGRKDA